MASRRRRLRARPRGTRPRPSRCPAAAREAARVGRQAAVVGVGGLSGSTFAREIDIADDRIASQADEEWNRHMLELMSAGDGQATEHGDTVVQPYFRRYTDTR